MNTTETLSSNLAGIAAGHAHLASDIDRVVVL